MKISADDLSGDGIARFLADHLEEMRATTPLESRHALDVDSLRSPYVTFWSVTDNDVIVGCGALLRLADDHAELKSMRTDPARRRRGVASFLLSHIIVAAPRRGFTRISLETGAGESFRPARRLYEKFGFGYCEPFADYTSDPRSTFMTRAV